MKFIQPIPITDAILVSSSLPETEYSAWSAGTTYALGDKRIKNHRIYESAQAANTNHDPVTDDGTWWIDLAPTNQWAMFDQAVGSASSGTGPITVVLDPGEPVSSIGLLDVVAESVHITVVASSSTIYDKTFYAEDRRLTTGWWEYFFEPLDSSSEFIIEDLPPFGEVTILIDGTACGTLAIGRLYEVGRTLEKPDISIIDYSHKSTNDFGVTTVLQRSYSKRIEANVVVTTGRTDGVARKLAEIRATPVIWLADDAGRFGSLIAYGYYKDWGINITYPHAGICEGRLTIEGLT